MFLDRSWPIRGGYALNTHLTNRNKKNHIINEVFDSYACVCVFLPFIYSGHQVRWTNSDIPAGVTQEEGYKEFLIRLPSAVRTLIFITRRIQPFLSLVDRCCCCCFLTLTDPLRIQPWSQDRRNQTKSTGNRR